MTTSSNKMLPPKSYSLGGANLNEPHTSVVYGNTLFNRPCPSQSRDTDMLHVPTLPRHATLMCVVVNSAVHSGDSYKIKNGNNGKTKSRDTRATNCEAGMRERVQQISLSCWCRHPSHAPVFFAGRFTQTFFYTFLHKAQHMHTAFWTRLAHA